MRTSHPLFLLALALATTACSSSSSSSSSGGGHVAVDASTVCNRFIGECKAQLTQAQCEQTFGVLRVSQDCASKLQSSSCAELNADDSAVETACFPSCSTPGAQTCNGDGTITICSSKGKTDVADCAATCKLVSNQTWTGTCGKTYEGLTSEQDKCWCK